MRYPIWPTTIVVSFIVLASTSAGPVSAFQAADLVVSARAVRIHNASFVFDGHNDLPYTLKKVASSSFETMDIAKSQPTIHTDIPRLLRGNVGAQYWSVYVPASTTSRGTALLETLEQIQIVHAMIEKYPETFASISNYQDSTQNILQLNILHL